MHGKQGHVAYPDRASNPIHAMARLVTSLLATPLDPGTAHFAPSNLEMTTLDVGNPTTNVVPAEARASFNIRSTTSGRRQASRPRSAGGSMLQGPTSATASCSRRRTPSPS